MSTNILPTYSAPLATLEGIKSEMKSKPRQKLEFGDSPLLWQSPWILPAYVVSKERDTEQRPIVKLAKCTIDTGNMQGNIVSQKLVELLGFPSSEFEKLTEEEEKGGLGITGDPHIPQGAIYLTWYHNNSTRVFRDMRFLISPSDSCDLIIGAWSVQKDKILDVPCLMASQKPSQRNPILITPAQKKGDGLLEELNDIYYRVRDEWQERKLNAKANDDPKKATRLAEFVQQTQAEVDVTGWLLEVYIIFKESTNNAQKLHDAADIWAELDVNWHIMGNETPKNTQEELEKFYQLLTDNLKLKDCREEAKKLAQDMNKTE